MPTGTVGSQRAGVSSNGGHEPGPGRSETHVRGTPGQEEDPVRPMWESPGVGPPGVVIAPGHTEAPAAVCAWLRDVTVMNPDSMA